MAYSNTVDERYSGFTEYNAYALDVGGTKYAISPGPGSLTEGTWAYGATNPSSGYSFSDTDVYLLGTLAAGTYTVTVSDFLWSPSQVDTSNIFSFSVGSDYYGFTTQTKYSDGSITFTVGDSVSEAISDYYVTITGGVSSSAQYALKYDLIQAGVATNNPATFSNATLTPGPHEVGDVLTPGLTYLDTDGIINAVPVVFWYRFDGLTYTDTGSTGSTYTITSDDVGQSIYFQVGFYDDLGNIEVSGRYGLSDVTVTSAAPTNQGASFSNPALTSGTHSVGTTLTAAVDFDDPNGVAGATLTYTW